MKTSQHNPSQDPGEIQDHEPLKFPANASESDEFKNTGSDFDTDATLGNINTLINAANRAALDSQLPENQPKNNAKQVAIICNRFWPDQHGGVETHLLRTAESMARLRTSVLVLAENHSDAPEREMLQVNLEIRRLQRMDPGPLWRCRELPRLWFWQRAFRSHIPANAYIWASDPIMALGAILAGRREHMIFNPACCCDGMQRTYRLYPHIHTMRQTLLLRLIDRLSYRLSKCVVLSSHNLRKQFAHAWGDRNNVIVIHHGAPNKIIPTSHQAARIALGLEQNAFVAGFVGRMDPCKDLGFLLKAYTRGLTKNDRLLFVGDGPDRKRIENLSREMGIADRILWTGHLQNPSLAYAAMDVMVLPSIYEAYGNVLLEAMGEGVPVIARLGNDKTTFTAADEIIDHGRTGLVVDALDPEHLAQSLRTLAANRSLTRQLGNNARIYARRYSWDAMVRKYLHVLGMPAEPVLPASASRMVA